MQKRFVKNLFYILTYILPLLIICIGIFIFGLFIGTIEVSLTMIISSIIFLLVTIIASFDEIFRFIIIDETGIRIFLLKKETAIYKWEEIDSITLSSYLRNPAFKISKKDGSIIYIDKRKKIRQAIELYFKNAIKE